MDLGCLNFCSLRLLTTVKFRVYVERQTLIKSVSNRGERCSLWHGRASEVNTPYVGNKKKTRPYGIPGMYLPSKYFGKQPKGASL